MINNIEGQSKAELIKIIKCQQEHDTQAQQEIQRLQTEVERLKGELEQAETLAENFETLYKKQYKRAKSAEQRADMYFETISALVDKLGVDTLKAAKDNGFPSDVFVSYINQRDKEQQIKALEDYKSMCGFDDCRKSIEARIQQLKSQGE